MQTVTIDVQQLNTLFGLVMPALVAFIAGIIRQDRFQPWINSIITAVVLIILAAIQTYLSNGGGDIIHFLALAAWAAVGIQSKYGSDFQDKVQTSTSIGKLPPVEPAPPALPTVNVNPAQVAALLLEHILPVIQQQTLTQTPVPDQPTQANLPIVRTNTPQQGG